MNTHISSKPDNKYKHQISLSVLKETSLDEDSDFLPDSLWQSPGGSLYRYINGEFICVCVHSLQFQGWINKVAIKNIHQVGDVYFADQAFRNMVTGELSSWEQITLDISENKIVKHFPVELLNLTLVNGLTEVYTRVYEH